MGPADDGDPSAGATGYRQLRHARPAPARTEQLALLRAWGCDAIQGFHLSKPVPADEFVALLRAPAPARACA
jgi:hypothetical protein